MKKKKMKETKKKSMRMKETKKKIKKMAKRKKKKKEKNKRRKDRWLLRALFVTSRLVGWALKRRS